MSYNTLFQALLRAILRDEMITWHKKNCDPNVAIITDSNQMQQPDYKDGEKVIAMVGKALTAITARLQSLGQFDGTESKVKTFKVFFLFITRLLISSTIIIT